MATPCLFKEANRVLEKPEDMTDDECCPLPVLSLVMENDPVTFSCWELGPEEIEEIKNTGKVWLMVYGTGHPPAYVGGIKPFSIKTERREENN